MKKIGILDYQCSNVFNLKKVINSLEGKTATIVASGSQLQKYDILILPGVGSFPHAMSKIKLNGLDKSILKFSESGKKIIGICLGMQLLFDYSEEIERTDGLGLIPGSVKYLGDLNENLKLPNVTWSKTKFSNRIKSEEIYLYYNHSYMCVPKESSDFIATTNFCNSQFCAAVQKDNIVGFQFHPELSSQDGIELLSSFLE